MKCVRDEWHERDFKKSKSKCNCLFLRGRDIQHMNVIKARPGTNKAHKYMLLYFFPIHP